MSGKPRDLDRGAAEAPTADLQTGTESSETLDAAFELLADPLRRDALDRLDGAEDGRLDLSTLAAAVASEASADDSTPEATWLDDGLADAEPAGDGWNGAELADGELADAELAGDGWNGAELADGDPADDPTAAGRGTDRTDPRSVVVELHHVHLPMLESHGVVAYDPEDRTVRYRERAWLTEWLDHVRCEAESDCAGPEEAGFRGDGSR
jgi:DNA-binding transcriptional ArsR family regulator